MRPGFTLVEVVVVLLVMMLASAVTIPALLDAPNDPLVAATEGVSKLLLDARLRSARTARVVQLTIDPTARRFWLTDSSGRELTADTLPIGSTVRVLSALPRLHLRFDPEGGTLGDTLHLEHRSEVRSIAVDSWSGAIDAR